MKWRWYEIVFMWMLLLVIALLIIWINDDSTVDVLNERVINSLWERENLLLEKAKLNAQLANVIEKIKNNAASDIGPTRNYENLRRRMSANTKEFRSYVISKLQSLEKNIKIDRTRVYKIKKMVDDQFISLLKDVSDLADVDNYATWREKESYDLSRLIQNRLDDLQHPPDCDNARKLVCDIDKNCGYGCQLHHVVYCFIVAYATDRTFILNSQKWKYSQEGWESVFLPLSDSCVSPKGKTTSTWPAEPNTQVILLPIIDKIDPRPPFLPLTIPIDLASRLNVLHGEPVIWWIGQFLKYLLRPNPKTSNKLEEYAKKVKFQKPIVGVHVRRTDKIGEEAKRYELKEYMVHVEQFYKQKELSSKIDKKRIYLATDEPELFSEAIRNYPDYEIIGNENISKTAAVKNRDCFQSLLGIITDIHFLSRSDYLVCTFSSQVCRVAYEIMNNLHPDASSQYVSLDEIYYFGGQKHKLKEAFMPHKADGPHEIDLQLGDVLFVDANYQNGYSKGRNLRTGKIGIYPTFKVIPKTEVEFFSNYSIRTKN